MDLRRNLLRRQHAASTAARYQPAGGIYGLSASDPRSITSYGDAFGGGMLGNFKRMQTDLYGGYNDGADDWLRNQRSRFNGMMGAYRYGGARGMF